MTNFYITKTAYKNLKSIFDYSLEKWEKSQAEKYISDLYTSFYKLANNPNLGNLRKNRSTPFLMYPSAKHYIVYEPFKDGIIIIAVLNQVRNIENIISEFGLEFKKEIDELRKQQLI